MSKIVEDTTGSDSSVDFQIDVTDDSERLFYTGLFSEERRGEQQMQ